MVLFRLAKAAVKYALIGCGILYLMQSCESKKQSTSSIEGLERKVIETSIAKADSQRHDNISDYITNMNNYSTK